MSWKDKMVVRILMIVAQMLVTAPHKYEISSLATHLSVHIKEESGVAESERVQ